MADLEKSKLSNLVYESDKDQTGLFVHLENFGSMVRSAASGYHLEDMLDSKLYRTSVMRGSVPSFLLLDPDFSGGAPIIEATNSDTTGEGSEASGEPAAVPALSGSTSSSRGRHWICQCHLCFGSHSIFSSCW